MLNFLHKQTYEHQQYLINMNLFFAQIQNTVQFNSEYNCFQSLKLITFNLSSNSRESNYNIPSHSPVQII